MAHASTEKPGLRVRGFETLLIAVPTLEKDQLDKAIARFDSTIVKLGGKVLRTVDWGKRHLAYEIKKHAEGHYVLIEFDSPTDVPRRFNEYLRLQGEVLRFATCHRPQQQTAAPVA